VRRGFSFVAIFVSAIVSIVHFKDYTDRVGLFVPSLRWIASDRSDECAKPGYMLFCILKDIVVFSRPPHIDVDRTRLTLPLGHGECAKGLKLLVFLGKRSVCPHHDLARADLRYQVAQSLGCEDHRVVIELPQIFARLLVERLGCIAREILCNDFSELLLVGRGPASVLLHSWPYFGSSKPACSEIGASRFTRCGLSQSLKDEKSVCRDPALQSPVRGWDVSAEIANVVTAIDRSVAIEYFAPYAVRQTRGVSLNDVAVRERLISQAGDEQ
jgi:hypothetical protein